MTVKDNDFDFTTAILIFIIYLIIDMLYAMYVMYVNERKPIRSAIISSFMYVLIAYGVVNYSKNPLYVIPLSTGAFIGTFIVVKVRKNENK
jgi:hypothetical protein